jgi:hypothetical protein
MKLAYAPLIVAHSIIVFRYPLLRPVRSGDIASRRQRQPGHTGLDLIQRIKGK